jgi:hypothetical protein
MNNQKNIIKTWLEYLEYQNKDLAIGLSELNAMTRLNILPHHIKEMRTGLRSVPIVAYGYLCSEVLDYAAIQCKFKQIHLDNVRAFQQLTALPRREKC